MKKILFTVLTIMMTILVLVSCSKKEKDENRVESETCDFYFTLPENSIWEQTYSDGMLSVSKLNDISKANITGFSFDHGITDSLPTSKDYWSLYYKPQLESTFGKVEVEKVDDISLGGQKHAHAMYSVTIGEETFDCETVLILYGNKVYTLTLTQGAKTEENEQFYTDYSEEFSEIAQTFTIN